VGAAVAVQRQDVERWAPNWRPRAEQPSRLPFCQKSVRFTVAEFVLLKDSNRERPCGYGRTISRNWNRRPSTRTGLPRARALLHRTGQPLCSCRGLHGESEHGVGDTAAPATDVDCRRTSRVDFLIRDRDQRVTASFDEVFRSARFQITRTPIRARRKQGSGAARPHCSHGVPRLAVDP
jgi:hypothetical protein